MNNPHAPHDDDNHLSSAQADPLVRRLNGVIRFAIRLLAVLMVLVILLSVADVGFVLFEKLAEPPYLMLTLSDIFAVFASFLVVLIAIEIFANITLYLRDDVIHVKLVVATALMAIARKVIVLDFQQVSPAYLYGTGLIVLALGVTYWLVAAKARS